MRFRDQPIARKALTLGLAPTVCALTIVAAFFGIALFATVRGDLARDSQALATVVADNMTAALTFDDSATAIGLLHGLRGKGDVDRACVFDIEGKLFATYTLN